MVDGRWRGANRRARGVNSGVRGANRRVGAGRYAAMELEWISCQWLDRFLGRVYLRGLSCVESGAKADEEAAAAEERK
eukprot:9469574-Pyramimonas_sp.AAC.2